MESGLKNNTEVKLIDLLTLEMDGRANFVEELRFQFDQNKSKLPPKRLETWGNTIEWMESALGRIRDCQELLHKYHEDNVCLRKMIATKPAAKPELKKPDPESAIKPNENFGDEVPF